MQARDLTHLWAGGNPAQRIVVIIFNISATINTSILTMVLAIITVVTTMVTIIATLVTIDATIVIDCRIR